MNTHDLSTYHLNHMDSNLHTRLAIVTKNELGLAFPPRNLPKKFCPDPSTFYLVIVVTNKQTNRQTNAGKNIIPRFCGDNDTGNTMDGCHSNKTQMQIITMLPHRMPQSAGDKGNLGYFLSSAQHLHLTGKIRFPTSVVCKTILGLGATIAEL